VAVVAIIFRGSKNKCGVSFFAQKNDRGNEAEETESNASYVFFFSCVFVAVGLLSFSLFVCGYFSA